MVSAATGVGVRVFVGEGIAVGVRVAVGGSVRVGVGEGPMAVGVRVDVGSDGASRLISNERTADQFPKVVAAPGCARTCHQKRRLLVKVCVVWVCVSPICTAIKGVVKELESSNWISYVTALQENGMLWLSGSRALFAGPSSAGAAMGVGVGGAVSPFVVLPGNLSKQRFLSNLT